MYQDYLAAKYQEESPKMTLLKTTTKPLQARKQTKLKLLKPRKHLTNDNKIVSITNKNEETQKSFSGVNQALGKLLKGASEILSAYGPLLATGLVIIGGIFALQGYLKNENGGFGSSDEYNNYYSGDSTGKMSEAGKATIRNEEGLYLYTYDDGRAVGKDGRKPPLMPGDKIYGTPTIGFGHTGPDVKPGMTITEQRAKDLFEQDIGRAEKRVNEQLKRAGIKTKLSQKQFDAMVEYAYVGGLLGPKFLTKLKTGDYLEASKELNWGGQNAARVERIQAKFRADVNSDNTLKSNAVVVRTTDAGPHRKFYNGSKVGNYVMANPVVRGGERYITLSARAEAYLRDTGGTGKVTSGSERGGTSGHGKGNKLDVTPLGGSITDWAKTAIPFIKNKNTAFINFEDFPYHPGLYEKVKAEILRIDPSLRSKFSETNPYSFDSQHRLIFPWANPDHKKSPQLHLDIGIIPNAYTNQTHQKENSSDNTKKVQDQSKKVNKAQNKPKPQAKHKPKPTAQPKPQSKKPLTITKQPTKPKTSANNHHAFKSTNSPSALDSIKRQNENYKRERK